MRARNDALVTILANARCPHCVQATDTLTEWCCEAGLPVAGIDLAHHPDVGARWAIEHSPAIVYHDARGADHVYTGFPSHEEFLQLTRT